MKSNLDLIWRMLRDYFNTKLFNGDINLTRTSALMAVHYLYLIRVLFQSSVINVECHLNQIYHFPWINKG